MPYTAYSWVRMFVSIAAILYAGYCIILFASGDFISGEGALKGSRWTVFHIAFWTLAPPLWFFFEYFLADIGVIRNDTHLSDERFISMIKAYANYASKIWAAVLAAIILLYTE